METLGIGRHRYDMCHVAISTKHGDAMPGTVLRTPSLNTRPFVQALVAHKCSQETAEGVARAVVQQAFSGSRAGSKARARAMTAEQRSESASRASRARWDRYRREGD